MVKRIIPKSNYEKRPNTVTVRAIHVESGITGRPESGYDEQSAIQYALSAIRYNKEFIEFLEEKYGKIHRHGIGRQTFESECLNGSTRFERLDGKVWVPMKGWKVIAADVPGRTAGVKVDTAVCELEGR